MIIIDRIRINGFRSIRSLQMPLGRSSVLLGANNCGKSTVLKALELSLSDEIAVQKEDFHLNEKAEFGDELWVDVRFVPLNKDSKRFSAFQIGWQKEFDGLIRRDHYRREYFAFRTKFQRLPDGTITKQRFIINHWDREKLGEELQEVPHSLQFVSIDAEENLREDLKNENSFVSRMVSGLGSALKKHPDYANKPIEDLRSMLDSLCQTLEGPGTALVNMALTGAIGFGYLLALRVPLSGPLVCCILAMTGFAAFGKHPRNVAPVMAGAILSSILMGHVPLTGQGTLLATLLCTGLAPIAGQFGWKWGAAAGFVHMAIVQHTSILHGGMNLYNNGFAAGLTCILVIPIIEALRPEPKE